MKNLTIKRIEEALLDGLMCFGLICPLLFDGSLANNIGKFALIMSQVITTIVFITALMFLCYSSKYEIYCMVEKAGKVNEMKTAYFRIYEFVSDLIIAICLCATGHYIWSVVYFMSGIYVRYFIFNSIQMYDSTTTENNLNVNIF